MFKKNCPKCEKEISFSTKSALTLSLKKDSMCLSCCKTGKNNPQFGKTGESNLFFGKKHTEESKRKIVEGRDWSVYKTDEFRAKISKANAGSNNPMYGRSVYSVWLEKYGKEIADEKLETSKEKWRTSSSGKNNPMYGKSSPKKAGNGWSGWYKGQFFRSLRELSYIVTVLEPSGKEWKSAESIRIPYTNYDGSERTYSPDFICDSILIEIKPIKLIDSPLIKLKSEAAEKYCNENDLTFLITDVTIIDMSDIDLLIEIGLLKLTEKTLEKYKVFRKKYES